MPFKDPQEKTDYQREYIRQKRNEEREEFLKEAAHQRIPRMILDIQERIDKGDRDPRRIREMSFLREGLRSADEDNGFWKLGFCPNCQKTVFLGEEGNPMDVKIRFPEDKLPGQVFSILCSKCLMSEMHENFGYPSEENIYDRKNMFGEKSLEEDGEEKPKCSNCGKRKPVKRSPRGWCDKCESYSSNPLMVMESDGKWISRISPIERSENRPKSSEFSQ